MIETGSDTPFIGHTPGPTPNKEFVNSLAKGLAVIRAFGRETPEMTLSEVAAQTGLTRAAARRFLRTLEELGYAYSDGRRFGLTPKVLDLGFSYLSSMDIWDIALPFMEEVSEKIRESCSASVLDGCAIVYVARVPTKRIMSVALNLGARLPAFATSMGRVLLAAMSDDEVKELLKTCDRQPLTPRTETDLETLVKLIAQTRIDGYALVDQELEEGLCSVSVPLLNKAGYTIAALNVSGHASRTTPEEMIETYLPVLLNARDNIARAIV